MPSTFVPAVKTLLACGLLATVFAAPGSVLAAEGKATAENPKVKAQAEAVAKADEAALKELEKVKAEYDKKLAEAQKKAAVARIGARNKAIEELTKDKKRAILAEKLDEAMALKEKIDGMQKEADTLLAEGNAGVAGKGGEKDPIVGDWIGDGGGNRSHFLPNGVFSQEGGTSANGKWVRRGDEIVVDSREGANRCIYQIKISGDSLTLHYKVWRPDGSVLAEGDTVRTRAPNK